MTIEDIYPLTPLQEGLLFHHLYQADSRAYCNRKVIRIHGPVDPAKMEEAFRICSEENAVLRTSIFYGAIERPRQVVSREAQPDFRFLDLSGAPEDERQRRLDDYCQRDLERGFDLKAGPLARLALIRFAEAEHRLIVASHHVALDGWSAALLWKELAGKYQRLLRGASARRELRARGDFKDYVKWIGSQDREAALRYWAEYLAGYEGASPLIVAREAGASEYRWACAEWRLSNERTSELGRFARAQGVTLNAAFLAAWSLVAQRCANSADLAIGSVSSGRSADVEGIESIVGMFVNTLPLRVVSEPAETLAGRARRIQADLAEAEAHGHVSLAEIAKSAASEGELFNHIVAFENYPSSYKRGEASSAGLSFDLGDVEARDQTSYDLDLAIFPEDELLVRFGFNENVYGRDWVARISSQLETLLIAAIENPETPLRMLPCVPAGELERLSVDFQGRVVDWAKGRRYLDLFAESAAKWADRVAVTCAEASATYGDLARRSSALAMEMIERGVEPRSVVAVCMDRSIDFLVSILATFKVGCAYMPIDPDEPCERLDHILARGRPCISLSTTDKAQAFREKIAKTSRELPILEVDTLQGDGARAARFAFPQGSDRDAAYVLFTSGSTGMPKGAAVEQLGMVNHLLSKIADTGMNGDDCVAHSSSQCFDVSVWQFLAALLVGGRVAIFPDETRLNPLKTIDAIAKQGVSIIQFTPSMCRAFVDEIAGLPSPPRFPRLRMLAFTGEALPPSLCRDWLRRYPNAPMLNSYGPTECADGVSHFWVREPPPPETMSISIGKPVPNARLHVVDPAIEALNLLPIGVPGELCIAGDPVGKGYLNDEERTRAHFKPDVFSADPNARLYRTGDLARWRPDGRLEYLGRIDNQRKINGFRIELGEVESALSAHARIDAAVVLVGEIQPGAVGLRAFYAAPERLAADELRAFLSERLPRYMVPTAFSWVERMPLNRSGKTDRKALQKVSLDLDTTSIDYVAPRTPLEVDLARLFQSILGKERIGARDDFFERGGHSLAAMRLMSRLQKDLGFEVSLKEIFRSPTVARLAAALRDKAAKPDEKIVPQPRGGARPASFAQERFFAMQQLDPKSVAYNIVVGYEIRGELDAGRVEEALASVAERHEILRTRFRVEQGQLQQVPETGQRLDFEIVEADGMDAARALESTNEPFDLESRPPIRARLFKMGPDRGVIALAMHHLLSDGVSMSIFLREFIGFYVGESLEPLAAQYADYAEWERSRLEDGSLADTLESMTKAIEGACLELPLKTDFPRPTGQSFAGSTFEFSVERERLSRLEAIARARGCTLYPILLTAFALTLEAYSKTRDFLIGANVANRQRPEVEHAIGLFLNQVPIRAKIDKDVSLADCVDFFKRSVEVSLAAQDLPFDYLVERFAAPRDPTRNPLFQAKFDYRAEADPELQLPRAALREIKRERKWARMDLQLNIVKRGDRLAGELDYKTALFERRSVAEFVDRLMLWLDIFCEDGGASGRTLRELEESRNQLQATEARDAFSKSLEGKLGGLRGKSRSARAQS